MTTEEIREIFTKRPAQAHKGNFGRVLLICGSRGMTGAAVLCARAALRSGAGLVTLALPDELFPIVQTAVPEAMCCDRESLADDDPKRYDAVAIGCGMGAGEDTLSLVRHSFHRYECPLIIDADGINALCASAKDPDMRDKLTGAIMNRKHPVIMTPHPGEADRMLSALDCGRYSDRSREDTARLLSEKTGAIIVLKGNESLIADRDEVFVNTTGNPGMATGGSGDVLTGITAAFAAYGVAFGRGTGRIFDPVDLVRAAVSIHGRAGDLAAEEKGEVSMISSDIIDNIPEAFRVIRGRS